jgi:heme A synthase
MNGFLYAGMGVVTFALIFYTIFVVLKRKNKKLNIKICSILSVGALFDVSGTILMIIGSKEIPLTVHGIIGYTALTAMILEMILMWRYLVTNGNKEIKKSLNLYTWFAYSWWVIAYFAGAALAMFELHK